MIAPAHSTDSQAPDVDELTDPELLQVYLEERPPESERAFSELHSRWTPRLIAFLRKRYGLSTEDAEDEIAKTWLRVHEHAHRFDQSKKFSTWVYSICGNFAKNVLRADSRDPMTAMTTLESRWGLDEREDRPLQFRSEADWSSPETSTANRQLMGKIRAVLDTLPPHHRKPMQLYHLEGYSYQEIAAEMDLALGTIKSRLSRARETFRERWKEMEAKGATEPLPPDDSKGTGLYGPTPTLPDQAVKEIREKARHDLPAKGDGQTKWCRRVAEEHDVTSSTVRRALAAEGPYQDAGPDLTEQAEAAVA